jgi:dTDP-4-dehydrorhamnose reductase
VNQLKKTAAQKKTPKVLITGAEGYVGSNLKAYLRSAGYKVYGVDVRKVSAESTCQLDLADRQGVFRVFKSVNPDVVIHTAALSSLTQCEKNPQLATKINVETTKNICDAMQATNPDAKMVFFSSDYVFDGARGNYTEDDVPNPATVYGKTKVQAENVIKETLKHYIILRTANVYGRGGNFFSFVLQALEQNKPVEAFEDVFYTPTYIDYLLGSLKLLLENEFNGIIHIAGPERLSRCDFVLKMVRALGKPETLIKPVKVIDKLIAKDSSLNCENSRTLLKNCWPTAEEALNYLFGNMVPPHFCHVDQRGRLMGVFQGLKWEEINYVESVKGSVRGNHYHKVTREGIFIIDGKIRIILVDLAKSSKRTFVAKAGDVLLINPNTVHTFKMLSKSRWINLLSQPFDSGNKDIHVEQSTGGN